MPNADVFSFFLFKNRKKTDRGDGSVGSVMTAFQILRSMLNQADVAAALQSKHFRGKVTDSLERNKASPANWQVLGSVKRPCINNKSREQRYPAINFKPPPTPAHTCKHAAPPPLHTKMGKNAFPKHGLKLVVHDLPDHPFPQLSLF